MSWGFVSDKRTSLKHESETQTKEKLDWTALLKNQYKLQK
jgi:hypothetical protein